MLWELKKASMAKAQGTRYSCSQRGGKRPGGQAEPWRGLNGFHGRQREGIRGIRGISSFSRNCLLGFYFLCLKGPLQMPSRLLRH